MSICSKDIKKKKKVDKKQPVKKDDIKKKPLNKDEVEKQPDTSQLSSEQVEALQGRRSSTWCYANESNDYPRLL